VEAELEELALEQLRGFVGQPPPAEVGMDGEIAQVGDPRAPVGELETHRAGRTPSSVLLDLGDEPPELLRLARRPLDLLQHALAVAGPRAGEIGLDLLVGRQLDQEVDVLGLGAAQPNRAAHGAGVAGAGSRRGSRNAPDPSATPPRISAMPTSS